MIRKTFSNISSNALPEKIPVLGKGPKGEMVGNMYCMYVCMYVHVCIV